MQAKTKLGTSMGLSNRSYACTSGMEIRGSPCALDKHDFLFALSHG